jgi:predicted choloylglycine hydrolase
MLSTTFRARSIETLDTQWQAVFNDYWPAYKAWYGQKKREDINPAALSRGQRQLLAVMPEMRPLYERFLEAGNDCPVAAQFLTGYQPPAYLVSCSQAVLLNEEPLLIRNYDLSPDLSENLLTQSNWLGQKIIGTNECLWGLNDGMNTSGLVASLTFGGSNKVGKGFGIPFIMRYVLQTCGNVRQAIKVLQRVPSHMAYNVTLVDRQGDFATVMLVPDQPAIVTRERCITNHQTQVTWPQQAAFSKTVERKQFLDKLLEGETVKEPQLRGAFLAAPLLSGNYQQQFGTVYTAVYKPLIGTMSYNWPGEKAWQHSFADFKASDKTVSLGQSAGSEIQENVTVAPANPMPHAKSDYNLPATTRRQLLQSLVYLPASVVGHPDALEKLKQRLRTEKPFCWKDYADQVARVWHYPVSSACSQHQ